MLRPLKNAAWQHYNSPNWKIFPYLGFIILHVRVDRPNKHLKGTVSHIFDPRFLHELTYPPALNHTVQLASFRFFFSKNP
jgi:hypothetical protein